jgi:protein PhnA
MDVSRFYCKEEQMFKTPNCPNCNSEYAYEDGFHFMCPECGHEWSGESEEIKLQEGSVIKDANGNELNDGDDVIVVKDLKIRGSSDSVKIGTKVRRIRLIHDSSDGHNIDCRIDKFGAMKLKSEFVKKA